MKNSLKFSTLILMLIIVSCNSQENYSTREKNISSYEDSGGMAYEETQHLKKIDNKNPKRHQEAFSSSTALNTNDHEFRFIRTAHVKYKTQDVIKTITILENAVLNMNGIVTYTNLHSDIINVKKISISKDSSLRVTRYNVVNNMTIRIPNENLDIFLKEMAKTVSFLDERIVKAENISLKEFENRLAQKRLANYQSKVEMAVKDKKGEVDEIVGAHKSVLNQKQREDEALLRNLKLDYNMEYSTVVIQVYQDKSEDKVLVQNEFNIEAYKPSFFIRIGNSISRGWATFLEFIIQLSYLWPFYIFLGAVFGVYIRFRK